MRHSFLWAAAAGGLGFFLFSSAARAVITAADPSSTTGDNQTQPAGLNAWNYVGEVLSPITYNYNASGTYVGNGWVLTADHVGADNFLLDGTTYDWNGQPEIQLTDASGQPSDLVLFKLTTTPNLPNLSIVSSNAPVGSHFYNIGYGVARNTVEEYFEYDSSSGSYVQTTSTESYTNVGFGYGSTFAKSWGQNYIEGFTGDDFYAQFQAGPTGADPDDQVPGDQVINGDSGGGAFNDAGQLIGINDALSFDYDQPGSTVFYGTSVSPYSGNYSYMINIAPFYSQIESIAQLPEPASLTLLAFGGVALLGRRRIAH